MTEFKEAVSRRTILQSALAATGALAASGLFTGPLGAAQEESKPSSEGKVILFQGDSITDSGRNRRQTGPNNLAGLGLGYPHFIAAYGLAMHPEKNHKFYNRGVSGNKVPDLEARWQRDTLDLKPDVLSILVGVNDIWHKLNGRYKGTVKDYEEGFTALLKHTREALPKTRIVICEPYVLRCGAVNKAWFPEFDERRAAARRVSDAAGATWVPFQSMFDEAVQRARPNHWAADGVHATMAGHMLMAIKWIKTVTAQ